MALGYPFFSTQEQRIPLQSFVPLGRPPVSRFAHWDNVQTSGGAVLKILPKAMKQSFKQKIQSESLLRKQSKHNSKDNRKF